MSGLKNMLRQMKFLSECDIVKIGNQICEDESNVPECGFDGGDCCLKNSVKSNCTICDCHYLVNFVKCQISPLDNS